MRLGYIFLIKNPNPIIFFLGGGGGGEMARVSDFFTRIQILIYFLGRGDGGGW